MQKILIVGAGPTGLCLATDLKRRGFSFDIVDKNSGISKTSKALAIQSGVLEYFDSTLGPGFTQKLIEKGLKVEYTNIHLGQNKPIRISFKTIREPYSFLLSLEQNQTEALLLEELHRYGANVKWNSTVQDLVQDHERVLVTFKRGETKAYDYVVGCDGAHSIVRQHMDTQFCGKTIPGNFSLADVTIHWNRPKEVQTYLLTRGVVVFFPFREKDLYRVIYAHHENIDSDEINFATFVRELESLFPQTPQLLHPKWVTRFRINQRMVSKYVDRRLILAGDAAHIHSPVGGQGMNLGIRDALCLSQRLTSRGLIEEKLEIYNAERLRAAQVILKSTELLTQIGLSQGTWKKKLLIESLLPFALRRKVIQEKLVEGMSQSQGVQKEITS